ncbi:uncharacterized protein EDB93DRAFT_208721 [Suillus bovinus]|uniref:uncharacterized protein n=1 Tax=Suillus bovinus TaxID=48563 RepID=UPI001B87C0C0|nr:uncharacterized protein EDB93DRAFT_208721 [Suillus bovinus]KAG2153676.1 hypothetical protein EDB93DRAFT_208721 [Suillus bovinus]
MYSFGCVMFHVSNLSPQNLYLMHHSSQVLALSVPWHDVDEYDVVKKIQNGECIPRPEVSTATSDVTDTRWNHIKQCWSINPSARPCALAARNFIAGEQEALKQDVSSWLVSSCGRRVSDSDRMSLLARHKKAIKIHV